MFTKVLIANRGAIVVRILRTLHKLGIQSVVVFSEADRNAPYVRDATESYSLGEGPASATYLDLSKLIKIACDSGAQAVHPGYGFLSENAEAIEAFENMGITWLGPTAVQVTDFGYKHKARQIASDAGVPLVPGSGLLNSLEEAEETAEKIGYPVILKSTAGGGGIGMKICQSRKELIDAFDSVREMSLRSFGNESVFLESYIPKARHLEVQLFGDGEGTVIAVGERDCSTQRRNQKVLEECPAPAISEKVRQDLQDTAVRLGALVKYRSAGTVEFIYDATRESFYFLEVNTRLQVEHGVTELVWNIDLVEWMVKLGSKDLPDLKQLRSNISSNGHAVQARLYAEDPLHDYRPCSGLLTEVSFPPSGNGVRVDTWLEAGMEVTAMYDPMLAKVITHDHTRGEAIAKLVDTLKASSVYGIVSNIDWLVNILQQRLFLEADLSTQWLNLAKGWVPPICEVLSPGTFTIIQDWPGRKGYWEVGVPPSGPFDDWSFRLGNYLLGNEETASGLEVTVAGPTLKFHTSTRIAVTGSPLQVRVNGKSAPQWKVISVDAGDKVEIGKLTGGGMRSYLLVDGGFKCPKYLGSQSTFTLGQFGGHCGRQLRATDQLLISSSSSHSQADTASIDPNDVVPSLGEKNRLWEVGVMYGPHGAPDFFLDKDITMFFGHEWEVHYNSSRTGIRLVGPRPEWARNDGGEAGLHPSNIHDNAYAFGAVDFTGDMPIILGPDGPSLGGFVCPATVIRSERWKLGQLAPGDKIRFKPVGTHTARLMEQRQLEILSGKATTTLKVSTETTLVSPIIREVQAEKSGVKLVYRHAGDDFLLVEFGVMELDIAIRFRVHAWYLWLQEKKVEGLIDLTPGVRSLQIHFDPLVISIDDLMQLLETAEKQFKEVESLELQTRRIRLPLSWDDEDCRKAIDYYAKSVRPNAPWVPSNLEFIRRINGLESIEDVFKIVFEATYLVLGLGDVYLGAPVATPLDPTHRLVTTKYNPARTWTAENSVGIGGAYLCVYGMEGPGGYQFVGRTLQMWNRYRKTKVFQRPWLLQFFDQLSFYKVSHDELMDIRRDFIQGTFELEIEPVKFKLADYLEQLKPQATEIEKFRKHRQAAFNAEIEMWHEKGLFTFEDKEEVASETTSSELAEDESEIISPVSGNVWKLLVKEGDVVEADQPLVLVESMKMEFPVSSSSSGVVAQVKVKEGMSISGGQRIIVLRES